MIAAEYIKTFIPIQELDSIEPYGNLSVAPVGQDDLLLMSQISTYADRSGDAIAVSKKIRYEDFANKLSSDFSIYDIKLSASGGIAPIANELSGKVGQLSSKVNDMSSTVSSDYIKKYGSQVCSLTSVNSHNQVMLPISIQLSNGMITSISRDSIDNFISPDGMTLAHGAIRADEVSSSIMNASQSMQNITYHVSSDCFVNCMISAKEDDTYGPLEVWISSIPASGSSPTSVLYDTLNNPGGFSGKEYFNNYHFSIPIKKLFSTDIVLKYQDNSKSFKVGSYAKFDCYQFYAVLSKDDLSNYVKKSDTAVLPELPQNEVFRLRFQNGVIVSATSAYYGEATSSQLGLIKVDATKFSGQNYGVQLDTQNRAYVQVDPATNSRYGVVRLSANYYESGSDLSSPLSTYLGVNSNGQAYVTIPNAHYDSTTGIFTPGLIRLGSVPNIINGPNAIRMVYMDSDGIAKVNVANQIGIGSFIGGYTEKVDLELSGGSSASDFDRTNMISSFDGTLIDCSSYGDYAISKTYDVNGWFMASIVYESDGNTTYSDDDYIQVICDNILITSIKMKSIQTGRKKFFYQTQLGVFGSKPGNTRLFAVLSNKAAFGNDKLHFLIKEMSDR